jgi:type II secretory ATPase GspE/PulE/Tfp pilus assembly ATPase PilB-like protein
MGVEPYLINSSLICVLAQRLVRKICFYCKEKYTLEKEIIDTLKLNTGRLENRGLASNSQSHIIKKYEFFRGKGCPQCFNTGYSGRTGIAEVLLLSVKIRELILSRAQEHIIKQQARKVGMKTLREEGMEAALKGITTVAEVLRVTAPDE